MLFKKKKKPETVVLLGAQFDPSYREIVDGRLYDTDKSEFLYSYSGYRNYGNFVSPTVKCVFKTDRGNYFSVNRLSHGYSNAELIDEDKVKEHLGRHDVNKYIELFGQPEEA